MLYACNIGSGDRHFRVAQSGIDTDKPEKAMAYQI